jgi:hypothetical protein
MLRQQHAPPPVQFLTVKGNQNGTSFTEYNFAFVTSVENPLILSLKI